MSPSPVRHMLAGVSIAELVSMVEPDDLVAVPPDYSGVSMAATRALISARIGPFKLLAVPTSGLQADLLVGAGLVSELEAAAVTLGEFGAAPRFTAALRQGTVLMRDSTCPAVHAALQASEKGVPFMPLRGLLGSDLLEQRADWKTVDNPFAASDPIVLLPAIRPDVALFHAPFADSVGNVWVGRRRELATMAHASRRTLVTVEEIVDGSLLDDERLAAGVIPSLYVASLTFAPRGAWPLGLPDCYEADQAELARYADEAKTEDGFRAYLARLLQPTLAAS
jgi:glutaconate CoA-transferase, subunit A